MMPLPKPRPPWPRAMTEKEKEHARKALNLQPGETALIIGPIDEIIEKYGTHVVDPRGSNHD